MFNHPTLDGGLPSWAPSELGGAGQGPSTAISPQFGEIQRGVINQSNLPPAAATGHETHMVIWAGVGHHSAYMTGNHRAYARTG